MDCSTVARGLGAVCLSVLLCSVDAHSATPAQGWRIDEAQTSIGFTIDAVGFPTTHGPSVARASPVAATTVPGAGPTALDCLGRQAFISIIPEHAASRLPRSLGARESSKATLMAKEATHGLRYRAGCLCIWSCRREVRGTRLRKCEEAVWLPFR
jgi:hypothetical protein